MTQNFDIFILIPFCILAETISVICFKHGVNQDEKSPVDVGIAMMILTRPILWLGLLLWAAQLIAWVTVLEHTPLSIAYPLMGLIYCTVPLSGKWFLGERLPSRQWLATGIIAAGVMLVGSTGI